MSISTLTNTINRLQRELADISKSVSQETKKESDLLSRIGQIQRTITKSTTLSALNTKRSEIERKQKEIATVAGKKAALAKKEADKNNQLLKARQDLSKEEERERKRISTAREREIRKENDLLRQGQVSRLMLEREINAERAAPTSLSEAQSSLPTLDAEPEVEYDLFISHASNDKKDLVEPLVEALQALGVKVWYDNQALRVGDSLRKKNRSGPVELALRNSGPFLCVLRQAMASIRTRWDDGVRNERQKDDPPDLAQDVEKRGDKIQPYPGR